MTLRFESQTFDRFDDRESGAVFEGFEFDRCTFKNVVISYATDPAKRSIVRNVVLRRCTAEARATIRSAVVEDVLVDGLVLKDGLHTAGAVYRHVTLKGRIGRLMLTANVFDDEIQPAFDEANANYYRSVDWALDISEAMFTHEFDGRGVPGHLVRRDPETQVLVTADRLGDTDWQSIDFGDTGWEIAIAMMLRSGSESQVFAAAKASNHFTRDLAVIDRLRSAGITEND